MGFKLGHQDCKQITYHRTTGDYGSVRFAEIWLLLLLMLIPY